MGKFTTNNLNDQFSLWALIFYKKNSTNELGYIRNKHCKHFSKNEVMTWRLFLSRFSNT